MKTKLEEIENYALTKTSAKLKHAHFHVDSEEYLY
jgi:hypothetical protein